MIILNLLFVFLCFALPFQQSKEIYSEATLWNIHLMTLFSKISALTSNESWPSGQLVQYFQSWNMQCQKSEVSQHVSEDAFIP